MEPIVNPWLIYLASIVENLDDFDYGTIIIKEVVS